MSILTSDRYNIPAIHSVRLHEKSIPTYMVVQRPSKLNFQLTLDEFSIFSEFSKHFFSLDNFYQQHNIMMKNCLEFRSSSGKFFCTLVPLFFFVHARERGRRGVGYEKRGCTLLTRLLEKRSSNNFILLIAENLIMGSRSYRILAGDGRGRLQTS